VPTVTRRLARLFSFGVIAALVLGLRAGCDDDPARLRVATFNIEDFPKDARQIEGAFGELAKLEAPIIAVEEIMDPFVFAREATARLGDHWQAVFEPFVALGYRHNGVLFDRDAFRFVSTRIYDDTRLGGDHKAVLEVRLRPAEGGSVIRVLVVHLKCCADGRAIRRRQYAALRNVVHQASRSGDRLVVLGDFNATSDGDRRDLAALASSADLHWSTESLACSAFWARDDGCPRSRLDHVITWTPGEPEAHGACATEGCEWEAACPVYREHISDHCPVVVELH
jgi:endonuclease/exonuclease/phosphatase family metal-dependent hydrolase